LRLRRLRARREQGLLVGSNKDGRAQVNSVLESAKQMLDEDMDVAMHMHLMILYFAIAAIRDAQIQEKRNVRAEEEEERLLDAMI